jgi:hypothetical protein
MFKTKFYQLRNLHSKVSKYIAESIFILCLLCIRLIVLLGAGAFLLALALAPAVYLFNLFDFLNVSAWGKIVSGVLWTFLWCLSLVLINFLIRPLIERLTELYNDLNTIIKDGLTQDKTRGK